LSKEKVLKELYLEGLRLAAGEARESQRPQLIMALSPGPSGDARGGARALFAG